MAPPSEAASGSEGGSEGGAAPAARGMRAVASSSALADADAAPSNATADTPKSDVPAKLLAKSLRTSASSRNVSRRSEVAPPPEAADSPRTSSRDAGTPEPAPSSPQDPVEAEGGGVAARGEVARRPSLEELALPSHSIDATVTPVPQGTPAKVRREGSGVPASPGLGTILSGPESQRVRESIRKLSAEVNAILKRTAHGRDAAGGESEGSAASGGESARLLTMLSQTLNQASAALEGTCTSSNPATLESSRAAPEGRRRSGAEDADAPTGGSDPFATDGDETAAAASLASDLRTLYTINRIAQATPREKILADAASLGLTDAELDSLLSQAYEVSAQALKESERIDKVLLGSSSVAAVAALSGDGADDDGGAGAQRPPQPLASHPLVTPPVTSAAPLGLTPPAGAPMTPDEQEAALELELGLVGTANSRMAAQASAGSSQLQYATPVQPHAPHGGAAPLVRSSGSYLARHAATPAHAEQGGYALSGRSGGAAPGSGDAGYARRGQGAHGAAPAAQRSLRSMVAGGRSEQRLGVRASHDASWSGRSGERPRARTPQPGRPRPDWQGSTRVGPHPGGGSSAAAKAASPEKDLEEIVRRVVMQVVGKRAGGGAGGGTAAAQAETVDGGGGRRRRGPRAHAGADAARARQEGCVAGGARADGGAGAPRGGSSSAGELGAV
ncbi:unnamed protein product [Pedinophyceae sp. YPF-701]|nr:unnamed protein product [Pedinophyceae sp. YPF-701]